LEKHQAQYKARHDKHMVDHQFQVGYWVWLHIGKEILKGEGKKIKPIRYGPFTILEKSGTSYFHLDILPYMQIYSLVNIEKLKLFEPPMIMDQNEEVSIPSIDEFAPKYLDELQEYVILDKRMRTSRRGDVDYLRVGLKGTHPSKAKWIKKDKLRGVFPHLPID
jgi:hypothetical protein